MGAEVRIHPVDEWPEEARPALERLAGPDGRVPNVFTTLANHPPLFRRWAGLGDQLLNRSSLPARTRELVILRTAHAAGSPYEWAHHAAIGRRVGLSDVEIDRVAAGPDAPDWSDPDRTVLRAVDELHATRVLSDDAWAALSAAFPREQVMELVLTVGFYTMTAMALNSFGVRLEDEES